jgi:rhamnosyl/mannosyltransferase
MEVMHIVHLYKDYAPVKGGIEGHLKTLAEGLVTCGFRITVVVCQPYGYMLASDEVVHGVRIIRLPRHIDYASNAWSFAFVNTIRALKPDLLHLQMPWPAGDFVAWCLADIPLVVSYQSDVIRQKYLLWLYAPLLRWTLQHAGAVLVSSQRYADSSPWLDTVHQQLHEIPLGIIDPFDSDVKSEPWSGEPLPAMYVLWVGRMRYYKGLETAIRAMRDVPHPIYLVLVGSGPAEQALRALAVECAVENRIVWLGDVEDSALESIRSGARCFVFPSQLRSEAYGIALLEAIAVGLPAISCEIGTGTSVINQHDITGLVIAPNDPQACAAAMTKICHDDALHSRFCSAARAHYLANYGVQKMVDSVAAIYHQLMNENLN